MTNYDVDVRLKDEGSIWAPDVNVEETLTSLILTSAPGDYTVIPLASIRYYNVTELADE